MSTWVRGLCVSAVAMVVAQAAVAAEASVEAGVFSKYVWRGQVLNRDAVMQSAVTASDEHGLTFEAWANFDLTDAGATDEADTKYTFTEVDLAVTYALPLDGPLGVELGVIEYILPGAGSTREAVATFSLDAPLSPSLSAFYDFDDAAGALYASLELGEELALSEDMALTLGASVGLANGDYNETYFEVSGVKWNDANVFASLDVALSPALSLSASAQYTWLLDSRIQEAAEALYEGKDAWVFGLTLQYSF